MLMNHLPLHSIYYLVINLHTNRVMRLLGKDENQRFVCLALYQGVPGKRMALSLESAASENPALREKDQRDPTLICTAYKRNRFFLFTHRDPESEEESRGERDVFNEKPSREEQTLASGRGSSSTTSKTKLGDVAILRTTAGDIRFDMFPDRAPKAVENFIGHAKAGYYDEVIFHRVIKNFMVQTGDPLGKARRGGEVWVCVWSFIYAPNIIIPSCRGWYWR